MKSIRLSLIVYCLLLLGAALGAVSLLAYEIAARALREKQQTNRQLLQAQHEEHRRQEIARLDNDLLVHARELANMAQSLFEQNRLFSLRFLPLGLLTAGPGPNGHVVATLWAGEARGTPLAGELVGAATTEIQLIEDLLHRSEDRPTDLFQVNRVRGRALRSRSLGERSLPFDAEHFAHMQMLEWEHDDLDLGGTHLRRVMLKAPIMKQIFVPAPRMTRFQDRPRREQRPEGTPPPPPPNPPAQIVTGTPPLFIQCATDRSELDAALAELETRTIEQLKDADDEASQTLRSLRLWLTWISVAVFAAVCVGTSVFVRAGLAPLRRLSEAVSRVSETNFKLQLEGAPPPGELVPIVERLQQTLNMLQRAFDREKQATADISHELRTPLAGLMTTVDVALRKPRSPEEYREALADCRDIVKQMSQLVERLLTLTWLDARSDALRREPVDIGELADQCAAVIRPLAKAHGVTLQVHKQGAIKIRTDPDKLREVMSNLLHNAVEYNRPDGTIDLSVRATESGLDVDVRDTGIGIAPEHRDRIFERFFRADESRHATGIHAGLGLAIVRGYVELLGGTISVDSEVGRGSTFHVHIPAARPQHQG